MRHPNVLGDLLTLAGQLRGAGLDVHTGRVLDAIEALRHVDLAQRDEVYHTLRTLFVHRHDDFATFDRVFAEFFDGTKPRQPANPASGATAAVGGVEIAPLARAAGDDAMPAAVAVRTWSDTERIASKDFASLSTAELATARAAIERLTWTPGEKRTRRWTAGRGPQIDLRRAWSRSLRTGGDIITLPRRRRRVRARPIVLLCDVSGSMEQYSRTLLHFAHALSRRSGRVEAFLFSTRLTRITPALRRPRADTAIDAAARAVHDWSGGTRIGGALRTVQQRWRRALHGGPVVLLISDGWDRGDPQLLRDEMARLRRRCHRLIWLNPLIGTTDYAPLTEGLQAALPLVDDFLPLRTLRDVRDLAVHLNTLAGRH
ncbi:MAG TPA: VWA domain-containing protein [Vicinamibacterales bacterium]